MEPTLTPEAEAAHDDGTSALAHTVQLSGGSVHVDDLTIDRAVVVEYLRGIAQAKQAIALVHALEVGVTELFARRERFRH